MKDLQGKVALITGGSKGIGYGIAAQLLKQGMKVAITSRAQDTADEAATSLSENENYVLGLEADVRDLESQERAVAQTVAKWGAIDVLIANAGVGHFEPIETLTAAQWQQTIDTNLTGVFYTVKAGLAAIKKSKGYIITISSLAGANFFAKGSAYNASKFGVTGFTQALMLDVRDDDVKVTTIMPGSVSSNFGGRDPEDGRDWRMHPEDIGQITVDLLKMNSRALPSKIEVRPTKTS